MAAPKRRWPGPEKAPFDRSGLMEWVSPHVARTQGTAPDGFGVPQEWRDNEPFRAVLTLTGIERKRSAARFVWHGGTMVGPTFTGTFPMFMVDACALMLRGEALVGGVRDGWWIIMKRGANYGVAAIDPPEAVNRRDAFEFARGLRSADVRAHLASRGMVDGMKIVVGRDVPADEDTIFRVWWDADAGRWDGALI